jgi:hypothetical protein
MFTPLTLQNVLVGVNGDGINYEYCFEMFFKNVQYTEIKEYWQYGT